MRQSVIAVISPAGGVGKSTLSKELACVYGATVAGGAPLRVCLVDADLSFGSQRALLHVPSTQYDAGTWLRETRERAAAGGREALESSLTWECMQRYMHHSAEHGVYLLASPGRADALDMTAAEADLLLRTLKRFFDVIIVDTPNNKSNMTLASMELATDILLVINDDNRSVSKCLMLRRELLSRGTLAGVQPRTRIVFNRYTRNARRRYMTADMAEEMLGFPVAVTIPEFADTVYYNNRCRPLSLTRTPFAAPVRRLAASIVPEAGTAGRRGRFPEG